MLTIVFLTVLGALAIAGIVIALIAGNRRRRKGQHEVPFENTKTAKPGRAPGSD